LAPKKALRYRRGVAWTDVVISGFDYIVKVVCI